MKRLQHEELKAEALAIERRLEASPDIAERRQLQTRRDEIARLLANEPFDAPEPSSLNALESDAKPEVRD